MADIVSGVPQLQARLTAVRAVGPQVLELLALSVKREATLAAPRKTGVLQASITIGPITPTSATIYARANYAGFVEFGTGIYGPRHRRITPQTARALRWLGGSFGPRGSLRLTGSRRSGKAGSGAGYIFARSTIGMRARPFMEQGASRAIAKSGLSNVIAQTWDRAV